MMVHSLHVYPVKSLGGADLTEAQATAQGLLGDRVWLLATPAGEMITARKFPQLLLWQVQFDVFSGSLKIVFADGDALHTSTQRLPERAEVKVWKDGFAAYTGDGAADGQLSQKLGIPVRLFYLGEHSARRLAPFDSPLTFADGAPFLFTNTASLAELNTHLPTMIEMARFRANIVVAGSVAYEEETWQRVKIGEVEFEMLHPCTRCVMPTIDLQTGQKDQAQQPLAYLAKQRKAVFGMNARVVKGGVLRVGDAVAVLD